MSDTTPCSSCGASVPNSAKFCTTCGLPMGDATNVEQSRPENQTQVQPAPGAGPGTPAAWAPPDGGAGSSGSQPWAPADSAPSSAPPGQASPQAPSWGQPPATGSAPSWQQPASAQGGAPPAWAPPGQAPGGQPPAWGQAPAASPTTSSNGKAPSPLGGLVAVVGGVLTLVGIFTAWVGAKGGESLTGWDLTSGDKILESKDPYILLVLAIVAVAIGVVRFGGAMASIAKVAALIVGVVIIGIMIRDWLSIVDVVKDFPADVKVEQKFGYFLGIGGGVLTAASALMPSAKKTS